MDGWMCERTREKRGWRDEFRKYCKYSKTIQNSNISRRDDKMEEVRVRPERLPQPRTRKITRATASLTHLWSSTASTTVLQVHTHTHFHIKKKPYNHLPIKKII